MNKRFFRMNFSLLSIVIMTIFFGELQASYVPTYESGSHDLEVIYREWLDLQDQEDENYEGAQAAQVYWFAYYYDSIIQTIPIILHYTRTHIGIISAQLESEATNELVKTLERIGRIADAIQSFQTDGLGMECFWVDWVTYRDQKKAESEDSIFPDGAEDNYAAGDGAAYNAMQRMLDEHIGITLEKELSDIHNFLALLKSEIAKAVQQREELKARADAQMKLQEEAFQSMMSQGGIGQQGIPMGSFGSVMHTPLPLSTDGA